MNSSQTIKEITKALVAAQMQMDAAIKDATNPHYKSSYADLASNIEAALPALNKNGIAVTQGVRWNDLSNGYEMITKLEHVSGEWKESAWPLVTDKPGAQGMGSGGKYARRYGLGAAVCIKETDDDGEGATDRVSAAPKAKEAINPPIPGADTNKKTKVTEKDVLELYALCKQKGWTQENLKDYLFKAAISGVKELTLFQWNVLMEKVSKFPMNGAK